MSKGTSDEGRAATNFVPLLSREQRLDEVSQMLGLPPEVAAEMFEAAQNAQRRNGAGAAAAAPAAAEAVTAHR